MLPNYLKRFDVEQNYKAQLRLLHYDTEGGSVAQEPMVLKIILLIRKNASPIFYQLIY